MGVRVVESLNQQQILELAAEYKRLDDSTTWKKAELFSRWKRDTGHTDKEIAEFCGCTQQYVNGLRRSWEDFGTCYELFTNLSAAHFTQALGWDDAEKWLATAQKNKWSQHKMREEHDIAVGRKPKRAAEPEPEKPKGPQPKALAEYQAAVRKAKEQDDSFSEDDDDIPEDEQDIVEANESIDDSEEDTTRLVIPPKPPTPKSGAVFDKNGQQVPPQLQPIFQTSPLLESLERDLELVARKAKELDEEIKDTNYVFDNRLEVILNHIEDAKREIRFAAPYVLCSHCNGVGCKECRTKGWVEQETWKRFKKG